MLGETEKTIVVPVIDDSHDEGMETLTLTLSQPVGTDIARGTAEGRIVNSDHMPKAWLARFGRTVITCSDTLRHRELGPHRRNPSPRVTNSPTPVATAAFRHRPVSDNPSQSPARIAKIRPTAVTR